MWPSGQIYAETESNANLFGNREQCKLVCNCRGATVYVNIYGQIYAETESNASLLAPAQSDIHAEKAIILIVPLSVRFLQWKTVNIA